MTTGISYKAGFTTTGLPLKESCHLQLYRNASITTLAAWIRHIGAHFVTLHRDGLLANGRLESMRAERCTLVLCVQERFIRDGRLLCGELGYAWVFYKPCTLQKVCNLLLFERFAPRRPLRVQFSFTRCCNRVTPSCFLFQGR